MTRFMVIMVSLIGFYAHGLEPGDLLKPLMNLTKAEQVDAAKKILKEIEKSEQLMNENNSNLLASLSVIGYTLKTSNEVEKQKALILDLLPFITKLSDADEKIHKFLKDKSGNLNDAQWMDVWEGISIVFKYSREKIP